MAARSPGGDGAGRKPDGTRKKVTRKKTAHKKTVAKKATGKKTAARKTTGRKAVAAAAKPPARRGEAPQRLRWKRWLLAGLVLFGLWFGGYLLYLAHEVRIAFDGKRWSVPARVYASPLELFVGEQLAPAELEYDLKILGYRQVDRVQRPAQWSVHGQSYAIATRPFTFWDGPEPARRLQLTIDQGVVSSLSDLGTGRGLALARLEPALIGSIYPADHEDRILVRRDQIPKSLVQGLLAVEDRTFYTNIGIDPRGIARALWADLRAGRVVEGGSTLTQQLVKNFLLSPKRSLWRKIKEALMAVIVDARYSKDAILEAYANEVFLGQEGVRAIHGFGLASYFYFNRPIQELNLPESALLVGLVKGASYYNPRTHPERALKRRNLVLEEMREQGFIDVATAKRAEAQPLGVTSDGRMKGHRYPAFIDLVRRQLQRDYQEQDLTSEGLRIFTTLNPWDQHQAALALADELPRLEKLHHMPDHTLQGAMVIVSPQEGEVRALVGGRDAGSEGFNRALDAIRQTGSVVKPAIYLTALSQPQRYTLVTQLDDAPVDIRLPNGTYWKPHNYDRKTHGEVPLYHALADSLNLATVHLGMELGIGKVIATMHALGVKGPIKPYPSVLLGAHPMSPLQVAQMYQTLAAGGFRAPLRAIREVLDEHGKPLRHFPLRIRQTVDPVGTFLVTRAMQAVVAQGTGQGLARYLGPDSGIAGKTGTTDDLRDSWFAGFGGNEVGVVWVGRDDDAPTGLTGAGGALQVFGRAMQALHLTPLDPTVPAGIQYAWADPQGKLSAAGCAGALRLPFAKGSAPTQRSDCALDKEGGFFQRLFR